MTAHNTKENTQEQDLTRLFEAGAHIGLSKARRHPTVKKSIFGTKHQTDVFDLTKTEEQLAKAKAFVKALGEERKNLIFVGGKPETHKIIRDAAVSVQAPYCVGRWIGGTLTNNSEIKKRVARLQTLMADRESGALSKYTKFERLQIDREIEKLKIMYEGLIPLNEKLPHALFVIDPRHELIAVREANARKIPVIALANSDCDISMIDYPITANDAAAKSIALVTREIASAYNEGRQSAPRTPAKEPLAK
jgi:small subunit ribosomal protein S2